MDGMSLVLPAREARSAAWLASGFCVDGATASGVILLVLEFPHQTVYYVLLLS